MLTAEQNRAKAAEYTELLKAASLPAPVVASVMTLILKRAVPRWTPGPAAFNARRMSKGTRAARSPRSDGDWC